MKDNVKITLGIALAAVLIAAADSLFIVKQTEQAIVLQFGITASSFPKIYSHSKMNDYVDSREDFCILTTEMFVAATFVLNTPCCGKSLRNGLLIRIIGVSPLPGSPPAP